MNLLNSIRYNIDETEKERFRSTLIFDNIARGRVLAKTIIIFEILLAIADVLAWIFRVDKRFHFDTYLFMYFIMIIINITFLLLVRNNGNTGNISKRRFNYLDTVILIYITVIMSWGSVVSVLDQKLYGQLIVFMIVMIVSSVIYFLNNKQILLPYCCSVLVVAIGLPFFQKSSDILIGHYVNLFSFVLISWVISRIVFLGYVNEFNNKLMLEKSKVMLEKEIEENKDVNNKLAVANLKLKKLALIDELTDIPNRRGFNNYIDIKLENIHEASFLVGALMIDIDFFKQYNDNYGHTEGDKVLRAIAKRIDSIIKDEEEFFCRWGGEEFIYFAFNPVRDITEMANKIRKEVSELKISHEFSKVGETITVSIGACMINISGKEDVGKAIDRADKALYLAKNSGRNCVKSITNLD